LKTLLAHGAPGRGVQEERWSMAGPDDERLKLRESIGRAGVVILVTLDDHGRCAGRPMLPLLLDHDPHIYFLTHASSRKIAHLAARPEIALTVSDAPDCYMSIAGRAEVSRRPDLVARLWRPSYRAWFPDGQDDRDAAVLCVSIERVDYWEPPRSRVSRLFQAVKALATHRPVETPMKTIDGL
jgi:general stress protein 26